MRILFLDGWQSTPGGLKPAFLPEHGHEVLNPPGAAAGLSSSAAWR